MHASKQPIFCRGDLDGFFGLWVDNLVQILLIVLYCGLFCGMNANAGADYLIYQRILPGVAVSLLVGNLFYAWQAHRVARQTGRGDVTALPYGINTPSLIVYVFFVMKPAFDQQIHAGVSPKQAAEFAWTMGLIACMGSGLIEFGGSFIAERIRRATPRAALLSTLAGIAIGFISMTFLLDIWQNPLLAMVPLAVILLTYFARVRFPWRLPGGFLAVLVGTALGWGLYGLNSAVGYEVAYPGVSVDELRAAAGTIPLSHWWDIYWPRWSWPNIQALLAGMFDPQNTASPLKYLSVIIPMGLFNVLGSLQNIESAEAAGDRYPTAPSLAMNGIGTLAAACFGSCFPTTIYIGHPGWKALGARSGYSSLNGLVVTALALSGTLGVVARFIPIQAGIAIVLWIGVIITAQAFTATRREHAPAVAVGLFPSIAAWGTTVVTGAFLAAGLDPATGIPGRAVTTMQQLITSNAYLLGMQTKINGFLLHGMIVLERGYIFTAMILAAIAAMLIDRRYLAAACWSLAGAVFSLLGVIHSYLLAGNIVDYYFVGMRVPEGAFVYWSYDLSIGYVLMAAVFGVEWLWQRGKRADSPTALVGNGEETTHVGS
jgi:AGZA family xanthine/uracil permease-like MFS transporter